MATSSSAKPSIISLVERKKDIKLFEELKKKPESKHAGHIAMLIRKRLQKFPVLNKQNLGEFLAEAKADDATLVERFEYLVKSRKASLSMLKKLMNAEPKASDPQFISVDKQDIGAAFPEYKKTFDREVLRRWRTADSVERANEYFQMIARRLGQEQKEVTFAELKLVPENGLDKQKIAHAIQIINAKRNPKNQLNPTKESAIRYLAYLLQATLTIEEIVVRARNVSVLPTEESPKTEPAKKAA